MNEQNKTDGSAPLSTSNPSDSRGSDSELLAKWMVGCGFATGHGDDMMSLLDALSWQIFELKRAAQSTSTDERCDAVRSAEEIAEDDADTVDGIARMLLDRRHGDDVYMANALVRVYQSILSRAAQSKELAEALAEGSINPESESEWTQDQLREHLRREGFDLTKCEGEVLPQFIKLTTASKPTEEDMAWARAWIAHYEGKDSNS
jgi:hypothetical protein